MPRGILWLRRDLRLEDNTALIRLSEICDEIIPVFVFDTNILAKLKNESDKRVHFIHQALDDLDTRLRKLNSSLLILHGDPIDLIPKIAKKHKASHVFTNRDYEPYAKKRDQKVQTELAKLGIKFESFKDHVIFESHEILNGQGNMFKVYTPYKNKWKGRFREYPSYPNTKKVKNFYKHNCKMIRLKDIGFKETDFQITATRKEAIKKLKYFSAKINQYSKTRDFVTLEGTSDLSAYIRHGLISIRELIQFAYEEDSTQEKIWLNELIWREFYQAILNEFPHVVSKCFKPQYDSIQWPNNPKYFKAWREGKTGYPIIDASMRCLNQTGKMHNRLRMITASFLCKTLLIDWKKGEKYFAQMLLDFDLAANNGGWQWCSSTGCDAQPYFRIFNPYTQSEKFDGDAKFIKKWCPELKKLPAKYIHHPYKIDMLLQSESGITLGKDYPYPIVDYKIMREECLDLYKSIK